MLRRILLRLGWQTLWNEDNWIKNEWFSDKSMDIDRAGVSTEKAFVTAVRESGKTFMELMDEIL